MPKKVQVWPENGIFVLFGPGLAGSFGWWLWRAGCISQDTYLLYDISEGFIGIRSERKKRKGLGEKGITKLSLERHQGSKYKFTTGFILLFYEVHRRRRTKG